MTLMSAGVEECSAGDLDMEVLVVYDSCVATFLEERAGHVKAIGTRQYHSKLNQAAARISLLWHSYLLHVTNRHTVCPE